MVKCGDCQLHSSETCDDGNSASGDGCSDSCTIETDFTCEDNIINATQTYSSCYYTGAISFSLKWIRKIEGQNTLKFMLKLEQDIQEWKNVNFTEVTDFDLVDPITNISTG